MMNFLTLYLILVILPGIDEVFSVVGMVMLIIGAVGLAMFMVYTTAEEMWGDADWVAGSKKYAIRFYGAALIACVIAVLAPDESQLQKIIGGYVITNVEGIEQLPENLVEYANKFLEGEGSGE